MRRISMVLGLALSVAVLAGCPPTYPKCNNDDQCKEKGEVCVQGQCQECSTDANCKEGFSCQGNRCVPREVTCTDDAACGAGNICEAGKCAPAQCTGDEGCGQGRCQSGRCVALEPGTCRTTGDCGEGQECREGKCESGAQCNWDPVRFGFNDASVPSEAQGQLQQLAQCIKGGQQGKITLAGHADERGTEEYNLQLSNRRAASVKKYLTDLGVPAKQLDAVGYGETQPANQGSDEEAWSENRRVEFRR